MSSKPTGSSDYYDVVFYAASKRGRMKPLELSAEEYRIYRTQVEGLLQKMPQKGEEITLTLKGVTGVKETKELRAGAKALVQRVREAAHKTMGRAAPAKGEIRVAIVRRPTLRVVETLIEEHRRFEEQLTKAEAEIDTLPKSERGEVKAKLLTFLNEVNKLRKGLEKTHSHFLKGEEPRGMHEYALVMHQHFPAYVQALQEWTICQKTAAHFNVSALVIVDENRPKALLRDFEELRGRAEESGTLPPVDYAKDWSTVNQEMSACVTDHGKWLKRSRDIKTLFKAKLAEENNYLDTVSGAYASNKWETLTDLPEGYDLKGHQAKLKALVGATSSYIKLLEDVNQVLAQGKTDKAIMIYVSRVTQAYSVVLQASAELIVSQDQLEGRIGTKTELSVDLYRHPRGGRESKGALTRVALETLRKILVDEDMEALKPLETALTVYQGKIGKTQFTHTLRETLSSEKVLHENLHAFNKIYDLDREALLNRYRAKGIPDAQISYLFSDLKFVEKIVGKMVGDLQKIVDEVNGQNYEKATGMYLELMEKKYPLYVEAFQHSVDAQKVLSLFIERGIDIAKIFSEFCAVKGKRFDIGSQFPLNLLFQRPLRHELFAKDILKLASRDHKVKRDARWDKVEKAIAQAHQSLNAYSDDIDSFIVSNGLPEQLLLNPDLKWSALLKKAGWTRLDIERLSDVYDAYGGVISTLFQMRQGYEVETDPDRKRALKAQMRLHVETNLEQINTIANEYHRLMTPKRRAALERAFQKIQLEYEHQRKELLTAMSGHWLKTKDKVGPTTSDADFVAAYALEFKDSPLVDRYRLVQQPPVQKVLKAFEERRQWVSEQMEFLHLFRPLSQGDIASRLLPVKEPVWLKALKDAGWTPSEIQKFQKFYDTWMHVSEPILLAKGRYDDDPENPVFLAELRRVLKKEDKNIKKLNKDLEKLGGIDAIKALEEMVNEIGRLQKPKASPLKITKHLQEVVRGVTDAMEIADTPQSSDPDYASFIYQNFPKDLAQQSWIQEMVAAYPAFIKRANEIVVSQRAHEANPADAKLREKLVKKLKKPPPKPKITRLKKAVKVPVETLANENLAQFLTKYDAKRMFLYGLYREFNLSLPADGLSLW